MQVTALQLDKKMQFLSLAFTDKLGKRVFLQSATQPQAAQPLIFNIHSTKLQEIFLWFFESCQVILWKTILSPKRENEQLASSHCRYRF